MHRSDEEYKSLIQSFLSKEISSSEFSDQLMDLWRNYRDSGKTQELDDRFQRLIDHVFSACDAYDPKPEEEWEINEEQLLQEVDLLAYIWWGICAKIS